MWPFRFIELLGARKNAFEGGGTAEVVIGSRVFVIDIIMCYRKLYMVLPVILDAGAYLMNEQSGILWLDLLNAQASEDKENLPVLFEGWITADSKEYNEALKVLKRYLRRYPSACIMAPGGVHHIRPQHMQSFVGYFYRNFRPMRNPPSAILRESRPFQIRDTDVALDDNFYLTLGIPYDELSSRQQQLFEEGKDELHEEIYGHVSRFDETGHRYITGDAALMEDFRDGLIEIFNGIVLAETAARTKGRRVREYITSLEAS